MDSLEQMPSKTNSAAVEHGTTYQTDVDLATAAGQGDMTARRAFANRLLKQVRRTMSYITRDKSMVDDLTQTALIRILNAAETYRGECSLEFWAARIAARVAQREFVKRERRIRLLPFLSAPRDPFVPAEHQTHEAELRARIAASLERLPIKQRAVVVLRFVEGYSLAEIAILTDAPENTVRERLRVAKKKLQEMMASDAVLMEWATAREP